MFKVCLALCLSVALASALAGQAPEVASTVKSARQVRKEFWDAEQKQPKSWQEFYTLKKLDKNDKQIGATEEVRDGWWIAWNKEGVRAQLVTAVSSIAAPSGIPAWYVGTVESYREGAIEYRWTCYPSGARQRQEMYLSGKLHELTEVYDQDGSAFAGMPKTTATGISQDDGERVDHEYYADGRLSKRTTVSRTAARNGAPKETTTAIFTESDDGQRQTTINEQLREAGRVVYDKTKKHWRDFDRKDGDWKFWSEAGKLTRIETYESGELIETKEFK